MSQPNRPKERQPSKKLGALSGLLPFLFPYKGLIVASGLALIITAGLSLVLPLAVRRVIDTFENGNESILDLDVRKTRYLDNDIIEILEDFAFKAKERNINIKLVSERGIQENPASFIEFFKLSPQNI